MTAFVPPPAGTDCSRKNQEMESWSVVSISQVSQAMPPPPASASSASRPRRATDDSRGESCGSSASPISSSTVDTTSTDNWVIARSGADIATKVSEATSPTAPVSTVAVKRWRCSTTTAAPKTSSSAHTPTDNHDAGSSARAPGSGPGPSAPRKGQAARTSAVATSTATWRCSEPISRREVMRPAQAKAPA